MKRTRFMGSVLTLAMVTSLLCVAVTAQATNTDVLKTVDADLFDTSFSVLTPYRENTGSSFRSLFSVKKDVLSATVSEDGEIISIPTGATENGTATTITIPVEVAGSEILELIEDEDGNTNGSCLVMNEEGNSVGYVIVKNDNVTGTVINNKIQLTTTEPEIKLAASSPDFAKYFSLATWGTTGDGYTKLSLYHTAYLTSVNAGDQGTEREAKRTHSWSVLSETYKNDYRFKKNVSGMKNQYLCHFDTVGALKNPWNLEVERPDPGYAMTVLKGCNPT